MFWNEQQQKRGQTGGGSPTTSPEASEGTKVPAVRVYQAQWTAPVSNRVLLEAAFSGLGALYSRDKPGNNRDIPLIQEQTGPITFGSHEWRPTVSWTPRVRAHLAYVTGSHNVKVGFDHYMNHAIRTWETNDLNLRYRVLNRVPNQITMYASRPQRGCHGARRRVLRAGRVDAGAVHVPGRAAVRLREQQRAGAAGGAVALLPEADCVPGAGAGDRLPGPQPAGRPGVGCVRHRADVGEGERGQVHRDRAVGRHLHRRQPDARADRRREPARP